MTDHPAEIAMRKTLDALRAAQARAVALKEELRGKVRALAQMSSRADKLRVVRELYWDCDDVRADDLTIALLADWDGEARAPSSVLGLTALARKFSSRMRTLCGPIGMMKCSYVDCDHMVPITSRSQRDGYGHSTCNTAPCRSVKVWSTETDEEIEARRAQEAERKVHKEARLNELAEHAGLSPDELAELFELMAERYFRQ